MPASLTVPRPRARRPPASSGRGRAASEFAIPHVLTPALVEQMLATQKRIQTELAALEQRIAAAERAELEAADRPRCYTRRAVLELLHMTPRTFDREMKRDRLPFVEAIAPVVNKNHKLYRAAPLDRYLAGAWEAGG